MYSDIIRLRKAKEDRAMRTYKVLLETKFVGKRIVKIEAKNQAEAIKKANKLENEYNEVKAIMEVTK